MTEFITSIFMVAHRFVRKAAGWIRRCSILPATIQTRAIHSSENASRRKVRLQLEKFVQQFEKEDFAGIRAQLPLILRAISSETMLRKGWKMLQLAAGPIISTGTPNISTGWLINTASVPIQFKRMKMTLGMQTTKSGTVIGLRFSPSNLAAMGLKGTKMIWSRPEYDMPELYEEIKITLGRGRYAVNGTLTLPRTPHKYPCVVLIGGSGPCDQDSTLQAAKPFKDMAVGLAREAVAVLRFDKVTFVHGRKLANHPNFTLTDEYCEHTIAAVELATKHPRIDSTSVFLAGHSLGAVVAPKLSNSIASVAGFILMAPPAHPLYWSAVRQLEYLSKLESVNDDGNKEDAGLEDLKRAALLADNPNLSTLTPTDQLPFGIGPHYWLDYRTFNPVATTQGTKKSVLVLQGEEDYQVTMEDDYTLWETALKGTNNAKLCSYKGLNHLFMQCTKPSKPSDYENACNVEWHVIKDIADWVQMNQKSQAGQRARSDP